MNSEAQDVFGELSDLVETLTTSGSLSLDQELFKRVKSICKCSDENVHHLYRMVMTQLEKQHAEIRLSSLQIIKEIFSRSHAFRELLTDNFQQFLELTIGTNADLPLPEPAHVATTLKTQSFQAVEKWYEKYGVYYKKLALGYNYVKRVKKFEFDGVRSCTALERQRAQDAEARRTNLSQQKLNIVLTQMGESVSEIKSIMTEMDNCFQLVLPRPEEFDIYEGTMLAERNESESDYQKPSTSSGLETEKASLETTGLIQDETDELDNQNPSTSSGPATEKTTHETTDPVQDTIEHAGDNVLNHHGLGSHSYRLNITLSASVDITETQNNTDILNTLREQQKQIKDKYLPLVQKWLDILTKHSGHSEHLIQAIDLKNSLTDLKQKFENLKVIPMKNLANASKDVLGCNSNSEEDEQEEPERELFVDVPEKEGVEHIPESERHEYGLEPLKRPSPSLPQTTNDEKVGEKSRAADTILWNPNGNLDDPAELGDPCSRASAVAAFVQKHKAKPVTVGDRTTAENPPNFALPTGKKDPNIIPVSCAKDEKRAELLRRAPVVPFDMDLYHWGKSEDEAPSVTNLQSLHCFWVHGNDENEEHCPGDIKESLKSRNITFGGEFKEVKWACRAPLASGKLCPRMDRYKCPFHGKIIRRDEIGQPASGLSDADESLNTRTVRETEDITRDVELATGMDLGSQKKTKGKKRKHPGLTDLKKNANTSRSRLEKIVFDKSSLERVGYEMDKVRKKIIDEKFGNNFNYALSK